MKDAGMRSLRVSDAVLRHISLYWMSSLRSDTKVTKGDVALLLGCGNYQSLCRLPAPRNVGKPVQLR